LKLSRSHKARSQAGVTLLEVVLAIAVFAFGLLALVQLQGSLARSSADATTRTVATNIAEEIIERARGFSSVEADVDTVACLEYEEMTDDCLSETLTRGDIDYTVTVDVTDYWYDPDAENFVGTDSATPPEHLSHLVFSDYKLFNITVTWNAAPEFVVDEGSTVGLDSGSINVIEIIPGTPPILGALVAAEEDPDPNGPVVPYTPGLRPDILSLKLGDDERLKESTSPLPDVIRREESVETWFDVVTYNNVSPASFIRREEFAVVSCECELRTPSGGEKTGLTPTVFNGYGYTEGEMVSKNYGVVPTGTAQSDYCDICCRDHHDGGVSIGSTEADPGLADPERHLYGPDSGALDSDHTHYGYAKKGGLEPATDSPSSDRYVEACRLVRKDGFMRVAQDFRQSGFYGFPEGYLETTTGASEYGSFVVSGASAYFLDGTDYPASATDAGYVIPASNGDPLDLVGGPTHLPTVPSVTKPISTDDQQLRSRGVYLDYLTAEAQTNIDHCFDSEPSSDTPCIFPNVTAPEQMYPFFDVQLTWLARWNPHVDFLDGPVDVSNDPVETANTHDRGRAELARGRLGLSEIVTTVHNSNLGFTATGAIDLDYDADLVDYSVFIMANEDATPYATDGIEISGVLSSELPSVKPSDPILTPSDGVYCGQTDMYYTCIVTPVAVTPRLTVSNYPTTKSLEACSDELPSTPSTDSTLFALEGVTTDTRSADIWIQTGGCAAAP
jgi:type II secretory pathway pseudopilin PulG